MRRLLVTIERDSAIPIDDAKFEQEFGDVSPKKAEDAVVRLLTGQGVEYQSVYGIAAMVGDGEAESSDYAVFCSLQRFCEKHEHWFDLNVGKSGECDLCRSERLARGKKS